MTTTNAKEPLLYIVQPSFEKSIVPMQATYHGKMKRIKQRINSNSTSEAPGAFKDLSVKEKIHYLLHLPREITAIRCEVITKAQIYRGTIEEQRDGKLMIRILGRGLEEVAESEVKNIRLISF